MPATPIRLDGGEVDLSSRIQQVSSSPASPSGSSETVVLTLTLAANVAVISGVLLFGFAAFTVGTSGASAQLRIKRTNTSGTAVGDTGATTGGIAAAALVDMNVSGFDSAPAIPGQVYVLTLTIGSGAAASTVSAASLVAIIV